MGLSAFPKFRLTSTLGAPCKCVPGFNVRSRQEDFNNEILGRDIKHIFKKILLCAYVCMCTCAGA